MPAAASVAPEVELTELDEVPLAAWVADQLPPSARIADRLPGACRAAGCAPIAERRSARSAALRQGSFPRRASW